MIPIGLCLRLRRPLLQVDLVHAPLAAQPSLGLYLKGSNLILEYQRLPIQTGLAVGWDIEGPFLSTAQ